MIAICVGHSRPNDSGAASVTGVTEWDYNSELADMIGKELKQPYKIYHTYKGGSYVTAMRWLARKLDEDRVDTAIELHFNAATPKATCAAANNNMNRTSKSNHINNDSRRYRASTNNDNRNSSSSN